MIVTRKQLKEMGYSRSLIETMTHHPLSKYYLIRTQNNGKFYYDMTSFAKYRSQILGGEKNEYH